MYFGANFLAGALGAQISMRSMLIWAWQPADGLVCHVVQVRFSPNPPPGRSPTQISAREALIRTRRDGETGSGENCTPGDRSAARSASRQRSFARSAGGQGSLARSAAGKARSQEAPARKRKADVATRTRQPPDGAAAGDDCAAGGRSPRCVSTSSAAPSAPPRSPRPADRTSGGCVSLNRCGCMALRIRFT
jgi:hypothetical protein